MNMTRIKQIAFLLFAFALGAGAAVGAKVVDTMQAAKTQPSFQVFGTLAEKGTWEFELAPAYTENARLRYRAAHQLKAKRISVDLAKQVQKRADEARAALDSSAKLAKAKDMNGARAELLKARSIQAAISFVLGEKA
jgi:hypothetical protein